VGVGICLLVRGVGLDFLGIFLFRFFNALVVSEEGRVRRWCGEQQCKWKAETRVLSHL
jgi:hypothetical protein